MTINTGIYLREDGKLNEALDFFNKMLKEDSNNGELYYQIAWCLDILEKEKEAVPYYQKAIELGLKEESLVGAFLGLGSTFRTVGKYSESLDLFNKAIALYPSNNEFKVFRAMVNYNLNNYEEAIKDLLIIIADTSNDNNILTYRKAIKFYSENLNRVW